MARVNRSWMGSVVDRIFAWMNSLPPETCSYTVESLRIPVADQIELAADLYLTLASKPSGTLLVRTPYGIGFQPSLASARFFAARGYNVLFSACRGTSGSDGQLQPGTFDVVDGHAVVAWMRKQPWYTGSFATLGGSYLGYTQWALLTDPPPDMKAAAIFTGPDDFYSFTWGTKAMYTHMITWAVLLDQMTRNVGFISMMLFLRSMKGRLQPIFDSVPLLDGVDKYFAGDAPTWLRTCITHPERSHPFWQSLDARGALDRVNIPIFLATGWYDIIVDDVVRQYAKLSARGCPVTLCIGPWTHLGAQGRNIPAETLPLVEEHLAGRKPSERKPPVRVFITGSQQWRELPTWPPNTTDHVVFLKNTKELSANTPDSEDAESTFEFNPEDPTPMTGAPAAFAGEKGRSDENNTLLERPDVLSFTSSPLDSDLEVCGKPSVVLHHSTDHPHADLWVFLSEVDSTGVSRQLSEKYLRLDPDRGPEPIELALHDIGHRFQKGSKIRLSVAGGSHPRYIRNLGSGENPGTGSTLQSVVHTVRHHATASSSLTLPVTSA